MIGAHRCRIYSKEALDHEQNFFSNQPCPFLACFQWCVVPGIVGAGQTSNSPSLTLEEAIKLGLGKNPRITMPRYEIDAQAARISQARSGLYPRIDFTNPLSEPQTLLMRFP